MRVEEGTVVARYTPPPEDNGYRGIVHGGIAMTLMDEVMTWAAILGSRKLCVAAEISTRFCRPMPVEKVYVVRGRVTRAASRLVLAEASVETEDGQAVATARGSTCRCPANPPPRPRFDFVDPPPPGCCRASKNAKGGRRPPGLPLRPTGQNEYEYMTWPLSWLCVDVMPAALVTSVSGA
jgi:uncharacterized protein (TIGR00369 family)